MKNITRRDDVDDRVQDQGTDRCEVLVVGAGPAGLTAAIALARYGVDVLVVERHSGTSPFPKATGVSTRTMEIFRTWGIEDEIRAGAIAVDPVVTVGETLVGPSLVTVPFGYPTDAEALEISPTTPAAVRRIIWSPIGKTPTGAWWAAPVRRAGDRARPGCG